MPDNSALIASLLMQQKQRSNPYQDSRNYGEALMKQGASGAPLGSGSPWEGVARALTGVAGGYFAGQADRDERAQDQANTEALAKASTATTPQQIAEALRGVKGNDMQAVLGQIVQGRLDQTMKQQQAGASYDAMTGGGGQAQSPGGASPYVMPAPRGPNPNNVGNITDGQGGFTQPASPQAGASDLTSLLRRYPVDFNNGQPMTLNQIAQKYAPPDNGRDPMLKGNNPQQWAANVAQIAGVDPNQPLDFDNPAVVTAVAKGINAQEKGRQNAQPAPVIQQGVAQGMDPAAFPPQAGPGVPGAVAQPPRQVAQGAELPPAAPAQTSGSPAGDMLRQQAQRAKAQGDSVKALEFWQEGLKADAAYATEAGKIGLQGQEHDRQFAMTSAEHDRQQNTATPNNEQALSSTFANRMQNSNGIISQFGNALTNRADKMLDTKVLGVGIPFGNDHQSTQYQQAVQARNDFINAQLRRESGAAISDAEYERADKQYFPQPGDKPEVLAQKARNRQLAVEGMIGNAGPTFKQSPTVGAPPQQPAQSQPGGGGQVSGGVSEGATATNPQTGQKIVFRDGQWGPAQ